MRCLRGFGRLGRIPRTSHYSMKYNLRIYAGILIVQEVWCTPCRQARSSRHSGETPSTFAFASADKASREDNLLGAISSMRCLRGFGRFGRTCAEPAEVYRELQTCLWKATSGLTHESVSCQGDACACRPVRSSRHSGETPSAATTISWCDFFDALSSRFRTFRPNLC
jgi:hypothetical protein